MDIESALAEFLLQLEADGRSLHTLLQYGRHVRAFARWYTGDFASIDRSVVNRFVVAPEASLRPDGTRKKPTSVNALRTSLRIFFAWAADVGHLDTNPARGLRRARCAPPPPRALHPHEVDRLLATLDAADGPEAERDRMLIRLMLTAGLRIGSAVALDVEDLDLDHREAHLRSAKGGRPTTVVLPTTTCEALRDYVGEERAGPVFRARGHRISVRHAQRRFRHWIAKAGLQRRASPHACRHTFATGLLEKTGNLRLVQRALGHRSIASTTVYAEVRRSEIAAVLG